MMNNIILKEQCIKALKDKKGDSTIYVPAFSARPMFI